MPIYMITVNFEVEANNPEAAEDFIVEELKETDIAYIDIVSVREND